MKRHEIQVLRRAWVSVRQIAELAGVSPSTVKRIAKESAIEAVADRNLVAAHGVGRPSKTDEYRDFVADILEDDSALPTVEILHRARLAGYRGGKSAFYDLVAELRSRPRAAGDRGVVDRDAGSQPRQPALLVGTVPLLAELPTDARLAPRRRPADGRRFSKARHRVDKE